MFLHIGKDIRIKQEDLIAILSIESILQKKRFEDICKSLNIHDKIIDVSDQNIKSLILVKENGEVKGYITNISSTTLAKRAQI